MEKHNVDDIFDDFEYKVEGKKEKHHAPKEQESEEEHMRKRLQKELDIQNKERRERMYGENKEIWNEKNGSKIRGIERSAYLLIILVLAAYSVIDLSFYHGNDSKLERQTITASVVDNGNEIIEEKIVVEEAAEEEVLVEEETEVEEEKKLSGKILMGIDKVYTEVIDEDLGYMTKIVFTIENGKEEDLTPIVQVFVYDSELHESWEYRSRGEYKGTVINSGDKQTGTIKISPKTFRNLDLEKNIRLSLNSTKEEFITAVNKKVFIS